MKKLLLLLCTLPALHFAQTFQWAKRAGLWAFDLGYGVATDYAGNVYIAGKYEMNANFGGTTVACAGNHDMYVAKYDASGNFKWVRTAGGTGGDYAWAIACDSAGNVYVTGEIERTVSFGSGVSLTSNGDNDIFIAKYNTNGTLQWARKLGGGTKSDKGLGISVKGSNVYITGKFESSGNFAGTTLTSAGGRDIFLAKYSTSGSFQWVKRAGGSGDDEGYAIANDPSGNIFITGYFSGTANFGGISKTSKGSTDIYVAKYSSSGNIIWVQSAGGTAADYGMGIKVDNSYRVFLTGGCRLKSSFGPYTVTASGGNADIFIARYDNSGNAQWVRKAGGQLNDYGRAIALDASSNIFITGNFGFTAAFGTTSITAADSTDIYFASYDKSGNFRWVLKSGGQADKSDPGRFIEMGLSIATDRFGNVYGSGAYRSPSLFGTTTLGAWDHTEIYLVKIGETSSSGARMAMAAPELEPKDSASFCTGGFVTLRMKSDTAHRIAWRRDGRVTGGNGKELSANRPGDYQAGIILNDDTLWSGTTRVTESDRIRATVRTSNDVFCTDSNTFLSATRGDGFLYQWKRNGRPIRGATSYSYQPTRPGNYQVKIIQGTCFEWSETKHIELRSCAADSAAVTNVPSSEKDDSTTVKIYPNPNSGLFTIEVGMKNALQDGKPMLIEVVNTMGQQVYVNETKDVSKVVHHHIELHRDAPNGVYFLRVTYGDSIEICRLMLQR